MPQAEVRLPGQASSVPTARRFVQSLLSSWGLPDHAWSASLIVSELTANCALHARTEFTVRVLAEQDQLRIEVTDGSRRAPATRDYGSQATTGRGLRLVADLSSRWGVDLQDAGKTVWVLLEADDLRPDQEEADQPVDADALLAGFDDGEDPAATLLAPARGAWAVAA